jgi:hypothetical protein
MHVIVSEQEFNQTYDFNLAMLATIEVQEFNCLIRGCPAPGQMGNSSSGNSQGEKQTICPYAGPQCFNNVAPPEYINPANFKLENGPERSTKIKNAIALIERIYDHRAELAACEFRCTNSSPRRPAEPGPGPSQAQTPQAGPAAPVVDR